VIGLHILVFWLTAVFLHAQNKLACAAHTINRRRWSDPLQSIPCAVLASDNILIQFCMGSQTPKQAKLGFQRGVIFCYHLPMQRIWNLYIHIYHLATVILQLFSPWKPSKSIFLFCFKQNGNTLKKLFCSYPCVAYGPLSN